MLRQSLEHFRVGFEGSEIPWGALQASIYLLFNPQESPPRARVTPKVFPKRQKVMRVVNTPPFPSKTYSNGCTTYAATF